MDEQIPLLRQLWTESSVAHTGATEAIDAAGLAPLPRAPIPIWIGCGTDSRAVARVGRLADGWLPEPTVQPGRSFEPAWAEVRAAAAAAGARSRRVGARRTGVVTARPGGTVARPSGPMA